MKQKHRSLLYDLVGLSLLPLLLFGLIVTIYSAFTMTTSLISEVENGLGSLAHQLRQTFALSYRGDYALQDGELFKGGHALDAELPVLDELKNDSGIDATIFYGDIRMLTTIREANGQRANGTHAASTVSQRVLGQGLDFFNSNVLVNGVPFFGYYTPITNYNHQVVGMVFVGKPRKIAFQPVYALIVKTMVIVLFILTLTALICILYAKRIIYDLQRLKVYLSEVAQGNLRESIDPLLLDRKDEIGEIGRFSALLQDSLVELVGTDPLTSLYNRRSCEVTLENLVRDCKKSNIVFSIAMGDIDNFKFINDKYGHLCGDMVLRSLSNRFRAHMENKGFVFRWGGEEFLFVYENAGQEEARINLETLLEEIRQVPVVYKDTPVSVTMTFGLKEYSADCDLDCQIKSIDDKLYWGKRHDKDQVVV